MPIKGEKNITTIEECKKFISSYSTYPKIIKLDIHLLSQENNLKYSKQINNYRNACGCETGTIFLILSIVVCIIGLISNFSFSGFPFIQKILCSIVFIFIFSIIGKIVGLLIAKVKLYKLIGNLKKIIV